MTYRIAPAADDHPNRAIWYGSRALGASLAEVVWRGRSKYETAHQAWMYLTRRADKPPISPAGQEGLDREPEIRKAWEGYVNLAGEDVDLLDPEYDFLRCQIDWMDYAGTRACDFKLTRSKDNWAKLDKALRTRTFLLEGDPWWYAAQHQLMILDLPMIDYYVFDGAARFQHVMVMADMEFIAKYRARAVEWWASYVVMDLPPPKQLKLVKEKA